MSVLKAPTGSGSSPDVAAAAVAVPPENGAAIDDADAASKPSVKASKIGVTAKLNNIKSSTLTSRRSLTSLSDARTSPVSPDEPMSVGGDASEKSRTPSPLSGNEDNVDVIDNRTFCATTLKSTTTSNVVDNSVKIQNVSNGN